MATGNGRLFGDSWEKIILARARSNGLLAEKNLLSAQYIAGGGVQVSKSDLDFKVFSRAGKVAWFDAKTFATNYFDHSVLLKPKPPKDHQITRGLLLMDWGINAGFLVWFRPMNRIVFYNARQIAKNGPGTRFLPEMGQSLGSLSEFDLRAILSLKSDPKNGSAITPLGTGLGSLGSS